MGTKHSRCVCWPRNIHDGYAGDLQRRRLSSAERDTIRLRYAETREDFLWRTGEVGLPKKARGSKGEGGPGLNTINLIDYSFCRYMTNFMVPLRARWNYIPKKLESSVRGSPYVLAPAYVRCIAPLFTLSHCS